MITIFKQQKGQWVEEDGHTYYIPSGKNQQAGDEDFRGVSTR